MKIYKIFFSLVLAAFMNVPVLIAHVHNQEVLVSVDTGAIVATTVAHTCSCGAAEHVFLKSCIKLYNKQFPDLALPENNDTEGLSENILQAIDMLAQQISFVTKKGKLIVPKLNDGGCRYLPMIKNPDYKLCKAILHDVDLATTLSAQELYAQWMIQLSELKIAQ